ncbi:MAG: hypothetical protein ACI81P_000210, partial [Neolewinella sp.]
VLPQGQNSVTFDGTKLPAGSYILQITVDGIPIFNERIQKIQ